MIIAKETTPSEAEFDLEKIGALPTFDVAEYLDSPEILAAYLSEVFADGDPALISEALNTASRATGTTLGVLRALGMQVVIQPSAAVP
jgi:DNA-binding phage protein